MTQTTQTLNPDQKRIISHCLVLLRYSVGLVFLMWTLDKFINPNHAASVFERFYKISGLAVTAAYLIGSAQLVLVIAFISGAFKKYSYGIIFILHSVSTLSTYSKMLDPWSAPNLLFYTSIPMLAACWALWKLRDLDTCLSFDERN